VATYAVTLDLWRTLVDESPATGAGESRRDARIEGLDRVLRGAGVAVARRGLEGAMDRSRESFDRDHDLGLDTTFDARVRELLDFIEPGLAERLAPDVLARALEAVDAPFLSHPPTPLPGAAQVIEALGGMGIGLGLISNTGFTSAAVYRRWLSDLGWLRWLPVTTFSNEAAVAKPTPAIFQRTLAALAVRPANALHVGDSPLHDVGGARRAGMSAAWLNRGDVATAAGVGGGPVDADYVLTDLRRLPAVVEEWLTWPRGRPTGPRARTG
jgi:HAD superfamily hydrolase (TIGR01549 family)